MVSQKFQLSVEYVWRFDAGLKYFDAKKGDGPAPQKAAVVVGLGGATRDRIGRCAKTDPFAPTFTTTGNCVICRGCRGGSLVYVHVRISGQAGGEHLCT
eukprot:9478180-Pyramimonas_sp.AAC.2